MEGDYLLVVLVLGEWDFPKLEGGFCRDLSRDLLEKAINLLDSFFKRILVSLSNNSVEQLEISCRIKKELVQRN